MKMKLALGTAQFGLDYGISNPEGKTPEEEVGKILSSAARHGVRILDTAALYGTSEEVLGKNLPSGHQFDIVTKTPGLETKSVADNSALQLKETFLRSLDRLRQSAVYGLMAHDADSLLEESGGLLMEQMQKLKGRGLVKKVGASVYTGRQIDLLAERYHLDIIQLPINILDQRLLAGGQLSKLKGKGVEIHARSVFLQGLLLMDPDSLPPYFDRVRDQLRNYRRFIKQLGITPVKAALGFVAGLEEVDVVICGVNNLLQLEEICRAAKDPVDSGMFTDFAIDDTSILNPSLWKA
ncbi:MAG: aldo/keto reductase [Desulfocucumaceae bacterium]